jgi:hypothetical protein
MKINMAVVLTMTLSGAARALGPVRVQVSPLKASPSIQLAGPAVAALGGGPALPISTVRAPALHAQAAAQGAPASLLASTLKAFPSLSATSIAGADGAAFYLGKRFFDAMGKPYFDLVRAQSETLPVSAEPLKSTEDFSEMSFQGVGLKVAGNPQALFFRDPRGNKYEVYSEPGANFGIGRFVWERTRQGYTEPIPLAPKALRSLAVKLRKEVEEGKKTGATDRDLTLLNYILGDVQEQIRVGATPRAEVLAKLKEESALADDEIQVIFPMKTSKDAARRLIEERKEIGQDIDVSWRTTYNVFKKLPDGGGYYAILKRDALSDDWVNSNRIKSNSAKVSYALARDPMVKLVKIGSSIRKELKKVLAEE